MKIDYEIGIIGTGFSGLNMAINLLKREYSSFILFEKSNEVGGVWRDNVYPGCTCDIKATLYSLKTEPNPNWTSNFPKQSEIFEYLKAISIKYNLKEKIAFQCEVKQMIFNQTEGVWNVKCPTKEYTIRFMILATGPQRLPFIPSIKGIDFYKNRSFHSSQWDKSIKFDNLNVAVIGTGASSIQIVPQIQESVSKLYLFQRTPPWVLPRWRREKTKFEIGVLNKIPILQKIQREFLFWFYELIGTSFFGNKFLNRMLKRVAILKLKKEVKDPLLREKLTPAYQFGCKRILISDDFYQTFSKSNVELVNEKIESISSGFIHTVKNDYKIDVIIFATGFTVADLENYIQIVGKNGIELNKIWEENGAEAYLGINVSGFPNLCFLLGPNSGLSHSSALHPMESQVSYILKYLDYIKQLSKNATLDIKPEVQTAYNKMIEDKLKGTIWYSGCSSWFLNKKKRNTVIFPGRLTAFRKITSSFNSAQYLIENNT